MVSSFFYVFTYAEKKEWLLYGAGTFFAMVAGVGFPSLDLLYGYWLEAQSLPGSTPESMRYVGRWTALTTMGVGIVQMIAAFLFLTFFTLAANNVTDRLRHAYLSSVIHQDARFFENVGPGEAATRLTKDIGVVRTAVGEKLGFIVWSLSTLITALVMGFTRAPRLAGVLLAIIPTGMIAFTIVSIAGEKVGSRSVEVEGKASTFLEQIVGSIRIVQAFAADKVLVAKYDTYLKRLQKDGTKKAFVKGGELAVTFATLYLVYSTSFWFGSQEVTYRGLEVKSFFTCFWNFFNALYAIANILPHITAIIESTQVQGRLRVEINRIPEIDVRNQGGLKFASSNEWEPEIELDNVSFAYPSRPSILSLDRVSMVVPAGKVTAIVGASGSGKSTIASLLLRYYDVRETQPKEKPTDSDDEDLKVSPGRISLGKHDLHDYNLKWLRSQIAIVSQEPQLFTASIFENVAYGLTGTEWEYRPETDDEKRVEHIRGLVKSALESAQAWDFVSKLPQGMDTKVSGARTGVLSGGQRQRIAAARALIRHPRILILDEGTSALDAEVEARLMRSVHAEQKLHKMTTILIAHRLSTIQQADNIIVMSQGRVVEEGTYNQLIVAGGVFANLVAHQLSGLGSDEPAPDPKEKFDNSDLLVERPLLDDAADKVTVAGIGARRMLQRQSTRGSESKVNVAEEDNTKTGHGEDSSIRAGFLTSRYIGYLKGPSVWFVLGSAVTIVLGVSFPIAAFLIGKVVKTFALPDGAQLRREAYEWSLWFLVISIVNIVFCLFSGFFLEAAAERLLRAFRINSLRAVLQQEVAWFDQERNASGTLTALIATYASNASSIVGLTWSQILACFVNVIGAVILGLILSWKLSLVGLLPLPFVIACAWLNTVVLQRYESELQTPLESASAYASEHVDNIKTVAALGREEAVLEHFNQQMSKIAPSKRRLYLGTFGFGGGTGSIVGICAIVMAWGTELNVTNKITIEELFASFEAVIIATVTATRLFTFVPDIAKAVHAFRSITTWEIRTPHVNTLPRSPDFKDPSQIQGHIVFKNCTMQYAGRYTPALKDVSFEIKPGQTVAFCGPSGGGKSTVLALINRFYDPSLGTIEVDGIDIRAMPLSDYRSTLALVSQDAILYDGTIRENITLGYDGVSQEDLEAACQDARILEFIQGLPDGFETNIGLKGAQMSGGQRQRMCIARALLRKPKILLLDEATSALDAESEKGVQEALDAASQGRTTICVAHRLSTIQNADVIYVIEDGQVVEFGNHSELVKKNGRYYDVSSG